MGALQPKPRAAALLLASTVAAAVASSMPRPSDPDFVDRFPQFGPVPDYNDAGPSPEGSSWSPHVIGDVLNVETHSNAACTIRCSGRDTVRIQFYRKDVVRIHLSWEGHFSDPASADIVVAKPQSELEVNVAEMDDHYEIWPGHSGGLSIRAEKKPLRLSMYYNGVQVWAESVGLSRNATASFQTLAAGADEFFFGGGMQNGRFSHRGHRIRISKDYNWGDGGNPNAVPFYVSSAGYGVYRNTWAPGWYDFSESPAVLAHNEDRFDAFYFVAAPRDFKALLEAYTFVTGRPFMPPVYGLGLGNADCYHNDRHGNDTRVVLSVAAKFRKLRMPGAWFLPNDGYSCGYGVGPAKFPTNFSVLDGVAAELADRYGFKTGLWSSTGLPDIQREVAGSGVRIFKTDIAWIGKGYKYAFDSVKECVRGIEGNSNARRLVWTIEGWAGTHRLAVMWTGDNLGSFEYLRWQIPTFVGAGFSAQAHVTGDIDGIFRGSPETYVRDLQFKCLMTTMMTMSGWARKNPDKQPWSWGEPYTTINRQYLRLKMRLTPYFYSLSRTAYDTGVPPVRAMALEFPEDLSTFAAHTGSTQQFMAGPWLLVAPVYQPLAETQVRDGIYLPAGTWADFWDGSLRDGPGSINGYLAPLQTLPIFVRAGAILPMWPKMLYAGERTVDPLILEVYPSGDSSFKLYEDDGVTRESLERDSYAVTTIFCNAPRRAIDLGGRVTLSVGASVGSYKGKLPARGYLVRVHTAVPPETVQLLSGDAGARSLPEHLSFSALDYAPSGWFFSKVTKDGVVHIKTPPLNTSSGFTLELTPRPKYPRVEVTPCLQPLAAEQVFEFKSVKGYPNNTGFIRSKSLADSCLTASHHIDRTYWTPALEFQPCSAGLTARQVWRLDDGGTQHLRLHSPSKHCLDVVRGTRMVIMYQCYFPANTNQQFRYNSETGAFTTQYDGSCMTVGTPSARRLGAAAASEFMV